MQPHGRDGVGLTLRVCIEAMLTFKVGIWDRARVRELEDYRTL